MSLRIISGERRGAKIQAPEGSGTRPLRDRLRESLINIIRPEIRGLHVLDAFAGSGAVGLECLSNGAAHAIFVEPDPAALAVLNANIAKLRYEDRTVLVAGKVPEVFEVWQPPPEPLGLLILMPPYRTGLCNAVLEAPALRPHLASDCMAVCEIHREEPLPQVAGWSLLRQRAYGTTMLAFYQFEGYA